MTIRFLIILSLVAGLSTAGFAAQSAWIAPDLITLEVGDVAPVLIVLDEQADLSAASDLPTKELKGSFVFEALQEVAARTQGPLLTLLRESGVEHQSFYIANLVWAEVTPVLLQQIAATPGIDRIVRSPQGSIERPLRRDEPVDSASKAGVEWNISMIRADDVWAEGYTGQGAVVGGIDTGYIWQHPAIKQQYRGNDNGVIDHNYNWHDAIHVPAPSCDGDSPFPCDPDGHGTHTMGTMIGDDGVGNQIGVAPGAKWIGCRCWEPVARTDVVYVIECMQWMLAPTDLNGNNPTPALAPHVINNSWMCEPVEGCTDPNVLLPAVQSLRAAGIVVVASAGNDGPGDSTIQYPPAIYAESFTVGAVRAGELIANFSSRGPVAIDGSYRLKPDVVAPGVDVRSAAIGSGYVSWDGTSMAGPHVAGLIALMISTEPKLAGRVQLIETMIKRQTFGSGTVNYAYGYGRVDAWRSYLEAQAVVPIGPGSGNDEAPELPEAPPGARIAQNTPNPFNPLTQIEFELSQPGEIRVSIYDAFGRKVRALIDGRAYPAGSHRVRWDGLDDEGVAASSGVYFCRLVGENFTRTRKMALIR